MLDFYRRLHRTISPSSRDDDSEVRTDGGVVSDGPGADPAPEPDRDLTTRLKATLDQRFGSDFIESSVFWLPPFLLMGLFVYGAIIWNLLISLTDYQRFENAPDYSNLDFEMYTRALADTGFIDAAINTLILLIAFTAGTLVVGLVLAILIDRGIRFENTFRTIYLLPMSLSFVVTAQFWLWIYNYNNGIANNVIGTVGLGPVSWLGNQDIVLYAVIFALMWQFSGYAMVVYLAGLRAIPTEHYEAATVDGASTLKMYWRVIIPQLKGATISAAVVLMVFGMKAFDFLYSLSGGYRPPNGADILATKMVREAYANLNWAYGSAIAIVLFGMALSVIGPYLVYEYRRDNL
ncbi:binding-protein-dependent transport systems inner membrane component [Halorubrum lacusprofundi ATCC 49239]|jgi:glucose/mannose transport system permease protein|uniref:Binding-protein-dependent transport systems inner membrane component n=1 Tax=Halorubrum lacusprofundi (strain ATCC 49239 / DSM 5036 / JCM 8891 / ACAM 34) TaxID=416348 RepID=B9LTC2_HALLT|nr:binding-protein-dependent transport systems inner membrane component [Halorubrum lacusprofundi ATCC 49239]